MEVQKQVPQKSVVKIEDEAPLMKTIVLVSHAPFGHVLAGCAFPRDKVLTLEIPVEDFDEDSNAPSSDSPLGKMMALFPGLIEHVTEYRHDDSGSQDPRYKQATPAKNVDTIRICAFSKQARGHWRARVWWAPNSEAPLAYDVPKKYLKAIEADKNLVIMGRSGTAAGIPANALEGRAYHEAMAGNQKTKAYENAIYEKVKAEREEADRASRVVQR